MILHRNHERGREKRIRGEKKRKRGKFQDKEVFFYLSGDKKKRKGSFFGFLP
jgi:hypothetical protein